MLVLITYDVNTENPAGKKRLRKVAKLCERSVFEVLLDTAQLETLKAGLAAAIDTEHDSVRFYRLGNHYKNRVDTMGKTGPVQTGEPLLL